MDSKLNMFPAWVREILERKFNVIKYYGVIPMDEDWSEFEQDIMTTRKDHYDEQDRYIIGHPDTDYYLPHVPYGLSVYNLMRSLLHCDIPLSKVIIISNCDIAQEIEMCLPEACLDRPTFLLGNTYFAPMDKQCLPCDVDIDSIDKHMCMVIGAPRSHRNIVYQHIRKMQYEDRMILSYKGKNVS